MPTEIMLQANTSPSGLSRPAAPAVKAAGSTGSAAASAAAPASGTGEQSAPVQREEVQAAVKELTSYVQNVQRNLNFSVDETSGQMIIKVIDSESEEVIRQIPPEEMLAVARRLRELQGDQVSGLLVQSQA